MEIKNSLGEILLMRKRNKNLNQTAISLRKNMTSQEKHLWYDFFKSYPLRIYRQRIIGNYIADFYCSKAKLIIELDGEQHYEKDAREYDELRTQYFSSLGIDVIRFSNYDIDNSFDKVSSKIDEEIKRRCKDLLT